MQTYKIESVYKGRPHVLPTDYADYYEADTEEQARALWAKDNDEFCDGGMEIVRVSVTAPLA